MTRLDCVFNNNFLNQTVESFTNEFGSGKTIQETEEILYSKISVFSKPFVTEKIRKDLLEDGWYLVNGIGLPTIQNFFISGDMTFNNWSNNDNKLNSTEALHSLYRLIVEDYDLDEKLSFDAFRKMKIKQILKFIEKNFEL